MDRSVPLLAPYPLCRCPQYSYFLHYLYTSNYHGAHTMNYLPSSVLVILINPPRAIFKQLIIKLLYIHTINYQLQVQLFLEDCRMKKNNVTLPFQNTISLSTLSKWPFLALINRELQRNTQKGDSYLRKGHAWVTTDLKSLLWLPSSKSSATFCACQ